MSNNTDKLKKSMKQAISKCNDTESIDNKSKSQLLKFSLIVVQELKEESSIEDCLETLYAILVDSFKPEDNKAFKPEENKTFITIKKFIDVEIKNRIERIFTNKSKNDASEHVAKVAADETTEIKRKQGAIPKTRSSNAHVKEPNETIKIHKENSEEALRELISECFEKGVVSKKLKDKTSYYIRNYIREYMEEGNINDCSKALEEILRSVSSENSMTVDVNTTLMIQELINKEIDLCKKNNREIQIQRTHSQEQTAQQQLVKKWCNYKELRQQVFEYKYALKNVFLVCSMISIYYMINESLNKDSHHVVKCYLQNGSLNKDSHYVVKCYLQNESLNKDSQKGNGVPENNFAKDVSIPIVVSIAITVGVFVILVYNKCVRETNETTRGARRRTGRSNVNTENPSTDLANSSTERSQRNRNGGCVIS